MLGGAAARAINCVGGRMYVPACHAVATHGMWRRPQSVSARRAGPPCSSLVDYLNDSTIAARGMVMVRDAATTDKAMDTVNDYGNTVANYAASTAHRAQVGGVGVAAAKSFVDGALFLALVSRRGRQGMVYLPCCPHPLPVGC